MDFLEADILQREAEKKKKKAEAITEEAIRNPAALRDSSGGGSANVDLEREKFFQSNPVMQRMALDQQAQGLTTQEIPMRAAQVPRADAEGAQMSATVEALEAPTTRLSPEQILQNQEAKIAPTVEQQQNVLSRAARLPQNTQAQVPQLDQTGLRTAMQGYKMMEDGVIMEAGAQAAQLEQEAAVLQEKADEVKSINESKAAQEQELLSKQREVYEKAMQFNEEMKTRQIDTDRFWNDKTTGQKTMLRLGVFLMGVGGKDGLGALNAMIDRDIAAQKESFDRGMTAQDNMVSIMTKLYGNEMAGVQAAKAMALENLTSKIEAKMATTKSAEIRAKIPKLVGAIRVEQGKLLNQAAQEVFKSSVDKKDAGKLSGEQQKRYDLFRGGLDSVKRMRAALERGDNTFSIIGDNDFTAARRYYVESFRANTGAAMPAHEVANYTRFAPKFTDSKSIQRLKLDMAERELERNIRTLETGTNLEPYGQRPAGVRFAEPR